MIVRVSTATWLRSPLRFTVQVVQISDNFLERDSLGSGLRHQLPTQLSDAALPLDIVHRWLFVRQECPRTLLRRQHFTYFELPIRTNYRIRVDGEIHRQLPDCRQLISRAQLARRDPAHHLINDLAVRWNAAARVQRELDPAIHLAARTGFATRRHGYNVLVL